MKNLSREQRYEMKMNFFSEVSVRELASKLLVAIIAICVIINGADLRRIYWKINLLIRIVYASKGTDDIILESPFSQASIDVERRC